MHRHNGLNIEVEKLVSGFPWSVHFEIVTRKKGRYNLRTNRSDEETFSFSGYPDFVAYSSRRGRMTSFNATRGIGETQSPTGSDTLTKSVGQVGIYTTGHLPGTRHDHLPLWGC